MVLFGTLGDFYVNANTVLIVVITLTVFAAYRTAKRPAAGFPPGPATLPFLGNIPVFISKTPAQQIFQDLAKKYGGIFSLIFNGECVIVLNSSDMVREAMLKKGLEFAGRPQIYSSELFTEGYKGIVMSDYSQQWRHQRKLGHMAIRHFAQKEELEKLVFSVTPEIGRYLDELHDKPFTPKWIMIQIVVIIVCKMCFGKKYKFNQPELIDWIDSHTDVQKCSNGGLAADFLAILRYIPTPGEVKLKRSLKTFHQKFYNEFFEHRENFDSQNPRDFMDFLLLNQKHAIENGEENADRITDAHLVHTVVDIVVAGTETSTITLHWAVALMAEFPTIQQRVAIEIDEVIGHDRLPSLTDIGTLPYTEATIVEIFRYGVAIPIGVPHSVLTDTTLGGYVIPKRATVLINHLALHYDPQAWPEPYKFRPERFLDENGKLLSKLPDSFLPFGCGRRVCLGKDFAQKEMFLLFVWLFGRYTIYKEPGKENLSLLKLKDSAAFSHQPLDEIEVCVKKRF